MVGASVKKGSYIRLIVAIADIKRCSWQCIIRKVTGIDVSHICGIERWGWYISLTRTRFIMCNNGFVSGVRLCLCFRTMVSTTTRRGLPRFPLTDITTLI